MVENKFKHEDKIGQPHKNSNFASEKNYKLGSHMWNTDLNASNPAYRNTNQVTAPDFPNSFIDDPYRMDVRNQVDSNNYNDDVVKNYKDDKIRDE